MAADNAVEGVGAGGDVDMEEICVGGNVETQKANRRYEAPWKVHGH